MTSIPAPSTTAVLDHDRIDSRAAALAAGRLLPSSDAIVAGEPVLLDTTTADLPGPDAHALVVTVDSPGEGRIALVVAAQMAEALQDGPLGASDLATALGGPLADAIASLERDLGGTLRAGVAEVVEAGALSFGPNAVLVPLRDGASTVAALVVELATAALPEANPHHTAEFSPLVTEQPGPVADRSLDMLHDVEMQVTVELGRTRMAVRDLLSLAPGAVVELDRAAGSPVDVLVNGKLIARGEVVVVDDDFGIRISEILGLQSGR